MHYRSNYYLTYYVYTVKIIMGHRTIVYAYINNQNYCRLC